MGRHRRLGRPRATAKGWFVGVLVGVMLVGACAPPGPLTAPPQRPGAADPIPLPAAASVTPSGGHVRVAYPDVPEAWAQPLGDDLAATDLAALWGLPLFRLDDHGQLRPGLVTGFTETQEEERFVVDLELAPGEWSDGSPVTADDVVATMLALREAGAPGVAPLVEAFEIDGTVRLVFDRRFAGWPYMLQSSGGVLPAAALEEGGLAAYGRDLPMTGGWFRLEAYEPGRSATFVANESSPLGRPALDRLTVLFVPRYEAALGFLDDGDVDAVLGHLGLNPVERAQTLEGVHAAAPLGGTTVVVEVRPEGRLGEQTPEVRREITSAIAVDQLVEGLLGAFGAPATSLFPGQDGPFVEERVGVSITSDVVLLIPRWHEALGFTGRTIERDLESHEIVTDLVSAETPDYTATARTRYDLVLRIRRDPPVPVLSQYASADDRGVVAASGVQDHEQADMLVEEAGLVRPLYRIGAAHAWRQTLEGIRPSAWPGLAFWNVGGWTLADG